MHAILGGCRSHPTAGRDNQHQGPELLERPAVTDTHHIIQEYLRLLAHEYIRVSFRSLLVLRSAAFQPATHCRSLFDMVHMSLLRLQPHDQPSGMQTPPKVNQHAVTLLALGRGPRVWEARACVGRTEARATVVHAEILA